MSGEKLFECVDPDGGSLQITAEEGGDLTVSVYRPGMDETEHTITMSATSANVLQLAVAAYVLEHIEVT